MDFASQIYITLQRVSIKILIIPLHPIMVVTLYREGLSMGKEKQRYMMDEATVAIFPNRHTEYQSRVWHDNKQYLVAQTPLDIIRQSSLYYWVSYEGMQAVIRERMGYVQKLPTLISYYKKIYAFPTHSPKHINCMWFTLDHILQIEKKNRATIITFKNYQQMKVDVSERIIQNQLERTFNCKIQLELDNEANEHR